MAEVRSQVWDRIEDDWHAYRELAKEKWRRVAPQVLEATGGRRDALIAAVERGYDVSREQARREVGYWVGQAPALRAARADARRPAGRSRQGRDTRRQTEGRTGRMIGRRGSGNGGGWLEPVGRYAKVPVARAQAHPLAATLVGAAVIVLMVGLFARRS